MTFRKSEDTRLNEEALSGTLWRTHFGIDYELVTRQAM